MDELKKQEGWFKTMNKFVDSYASHFTPIEIAVYITICRYRKNGMNESVPVSQDKIAKKLDLCREVVNRAIKPLEDHKFIKRIKLSGRLGGKWQHIKYEILGDDSWIPPCDYKSHGEEASPCDICVKNGVNNCHTKKTTEKNTNIEQILERKGKVANGMRLPWRSDINKQKT